MTASEQSFSTLSSDSESEVKAVFTDMTKLERDLLLLLGGGPFTRDQIVRNLKAPRTTVYDKLKRLIIRNLIKKYPVYATERCRGRPQVLYALLD